MDLEGVAISREVGLAEDTIGGSGWTGLLGVSFEGGGGMAFDTDVVVAFGGGDGGVGSGGGGCF